MEVNNNVLVGMIANQTIDPEDIGVIKWASPEGGYEILIFPDGGMYGLELGWSVGGAVLTLAQICQAMGFSECPSPWGTTFDNLAVEWLGDRYGYQAKCSIEASVSIDIQNKVVTFSHNGEVVICSPDGEYNWVD